MRIFTLLLWMVQQKINTEDLLHQANEDLEKMVAKRTAELEVIIQELQGTLAEVKTLRGIVPICAKCKKIRDDKGFWNQVEQYVTDHTEAKFSHGLCPACFDEEMINLSSG